MEREEPSFGKDTGDPEFRPRSYRGSASPRRSQPEGLAWKIGVAVGAGVLAALLIFNQFERYQARRDAEQAMAVLAAQSQQVEQQLSQLDALASSRLHDARARAVRTLKPVPPGFRCVKGVLLRREGNAWTQITVRSRQLYCPPGGSVSDCYVVTPESVGCR